MKSILFLIFSCFFALSLPCNIAAEQTDHCHCFRDRSFDPANRFAADDYLLTTSFNSLIAATLQVSKRQIVMMKMKGGVDPDTLLTALYIAHRTEAPVDVLLAIHDNGGSWQSILNAPARQEKTNADPVLSKIGAGAAKEETNKLVTNAMLTIYYKTPAKTINGLRSQNFSSKEIGLLFALHHQASTPMPEIIAMSRQKKMSWSEIAHQFNLTPSGIGKSILGEQT